VIIWTGWGILVFVFGLGALVIAQALANAVLGAGYYETNAWPKIAAAVVAAILMWLVGRRLNGAPGRTVVDKQTGREMTLRRRHTFFFIPMEYWAPIVVVLVVALELFAR
jgi:hypothetical protein